MKYIFFGLALIVAALAPAAPVALAQDCPRGLVNDPYPGACGAYIDANNDGYCDHSQDISALEAASGQVGDGQAGIVVPEAEESQTAVQEKIPAEQIPAVGGQTVLPIVADDQKTAAPSRKPVDYFMWQIALGILAAYWFSSLLVKKGKITIFNQRKFWNLVLLVLFLAAAFTSIVLLFEINYQIVLRLPFNINFLHIESGWAMIVAAFLHAAWHWPYFKSYCPKKKSQ